MYGLTVSAYDCSVRWISAVLLKWLVTLAAFRNLIQHLQQNKRAEELLMKYFIAIVVVGLAVSAGVSAQTPAQTTHDTYCIVCHGTEVYTRQSRIANDYASLREQVDRWQSNVSLNWTSTQIDMMADWLATRYYGFDCPDEC